MGFFPAHSVLAVVLTGTAANCTAVSCRKPLLFEESTTIKIEKPKKLLMPSSLCQLQNICFSAVNLLVLFSASNLFFFFDILQQAFFYLPVSPFLYFFKWGQPTKAVPKVQGGTACRQALCGCSQHHPICSPISFQS